MRPLCLRPLRFAPLLVSVLACGEDAPAPAEAMAGPEAMAEPATEPAPASTPSPITPAAPGASCDPTDGSGCADGQHCLWSSETASAECGTLSTQNAFGTACDTTRQECAPGLTCTDPGSGNTACLKVCSPADPTDCDLPDQMLNFTCEVAAGDYGVCAPVITACTPGGGDCSPTENCVPTVTGAFVCIPQGAVPFGQACELTSECAAGGLCAAASADSPRTCLQTCDLAAGCAAEDEACRQVQDQAFGVCQQVGALCELATDTCGATETCTLSAVVDNMPEFRCAQAGSAQLGEACDPIDNNCAKGGACLDVGEGFMCFEACTLGVEPNGCTSPTAVCNGIQGTTGLCVDVPNQCSPVSNLCPAGEVCALRSVGVVCEPEGVAELGESCADGATCTAPGLCVAGVNDGQGGTIPEVCYEVCDPVQPVCTDPLSQCGLVPGIDFGFCL